jgi:hypothetical protein
MALAYDKEMTDLHMEMVEVGTKVLPVLNKGLEATAFTFGAIGHEIHIVTNFIDDLIGDAGKLMNVLDVGGWEGKVGDAFGWMGGKISDAGDAADKATGQTANDTGAMASARAQAEDLARAQGLNAEETARAGDAAAKAATQTDDNADAMNKARAAAEAYGKAMGDTAGQITAEGNAAAAAAAKNGVDSRGVPIGGYSTSGFVPSYDEGGVVPGLPGAPQLAIVHGGEVISKAGKGSGTTINVYGRVINNLQPGEVNTAKQLDRLFRGS